MNRATSILLAFGILGLALPAQAQLNGSHTLGDFGVQSGSQPSPGTYAVLFLDRYDTDTINDADGNPIRTSSSDPSSLGMTAAAPMLWWVGKGKVLGANAGVLVVLPFANASIEAPAFGLGRDFGAGAGDLLIRPIDLGWHAKRADLSAGLQIYAPTGRYDAEANDNLGKGMWSYEPFVGTTAYFDEARTLSLATTAYWEIHGTKKDSDVQVGQLLTLQGGLGKSFLDGGLIVGGAYYAQWKLTNDRLGEFGGRDLEFPGKHRVFAFGPDVTLPIASKSTLFALVNIRYMWETGAQLKTKGNSLLVTATFPVPSVKLS
jgi:hypothetical protein